MEFDSAAVLNFWFAEDARSPEGYQARNEIWFKRPDVAFDRQIRVRFEAQVSAAAELCKSGLSTDARQNLARIIATDQFPRNIYRGTPRAFEYDTLALSVTKNMLDNGMHEELCFVERLFTYLPLEHSECLDNQIRSVRMFRELQQSVEHPIFQIAAQEAIDYAVLHHDIIEQFGRFPHRNAIIGRASTREELAYLELGAETFGQVQK